MNGPRASVSVSGRRRHRGEGFPSFGDYLGSLGFGPLWFVEALIVFTLLYALWRSLTRDRAVPDAAAYGPPTYRMIAGFTAGLAVVTYLWRTVVPVGLWVPVIDFPTLGYLPQYASLFVLGLIAYRRDWFGSIPDRMGKAGFGVAAGATVVFFPLALAGIPASFGGGSWQSVFYALWDSTFSVGMALGLLMLFRKRFDVQRRFGRFLSAHAYAVYVIHAPVIVALAIALAGLDLYPLLEFGLAVAVGVPLCFAVAYLVRKLPFASRIM